MRPLTVGAVVLCILLAGCGTSTSPATEAPTTTTGSDGVMEPPATPESSETQTATPTPTTTPEPSYDNPWDEPVIAVYVESSGEREFTPHVHRALRWWEKRAPTATDYEDVEFELTETRTNAKLVISFTDEVRCGVGPDADAAVGCAPLPGDDGTFSTETPTISANNGYTNESTVTILKHELGHLLDLEHNQGPEFMKPAGDLATLPQRDAVDKPNPWEQQTVYVYVDQSEVPVPVDDAVERQMDHVLTYFNAGGEGATPPNTTLTRVNSREKSDIVVEVVRNDEIEQDDYATGAWYGLDPDDDDRLETVTNATIRVAYNVRGEKGYIGWATGYYVAAALQATYENPPPPWSDDSIAYSDEWWTRA